MPVAGPTLESFAARNKCCHADASIRGSASAAIPQALALPNVKAESSGLTMPSIVARPILGKNSAMDSSTCALAERNSCSLSRISEHGRYLAKTPPAHAAIRPRHPKLPHDIPCHWPSHRRRHEPASHFPDKMMRDLLRYSRKFDERLPSAR